MSHIKLKRINIRIRCDETFHALSQKVLSEWGSNVVVFFLFSFFFVCFFCCFLCVCFVVVVFS